MPLSGTTAPVNQLSGLATPEQNLSSLMNIYNARGTSGASNYDYGHMDYSGDVPTFQQGAAPTGGYNWQGLLDMYNPYQATGFDAQGQPIGQDKSGPRMFDARNLAQFDQFANNPMYTGMYGAAPTGGTDAEKLDWMNLLNFGGATEAGRQSTIAENSRTDMTESLLMAAAMAGVGGLAMAGAGLGGAGMAGAEAGMGSAAGTFGEWVPGMTGGADFAGIGGATSGAGGVGAGAGGASFGTGEAVSGFYGPSAGELSGAASSYGGAGTGGLGVSDLTKLPTGVPGGGGGGGMSTPRPDGVFDPTKTSWTDVGTGGTGGATDWLTKLLGGGAGGSGVWGTASSIGSLLSGLLGLSNARDLEKTGAAIENRMDPAKPIRDQAQPELLALMHDPSSIVNRPGFGAGQLAIDRSLAKQGFNPANVAGVSGNYLDAHSRYAGEFYDKEMQRLMEMSQVRVPPSGGQFAMQGLMGQTGVTGASTQSIIAGLLGLGKNLFGP